MGTILIQVASVLWSVQPRVFAISHPVSELVKFRWWVSLSVFVSILFGSLELRGDTLQHNAEHPFDSGTGGPPSEFCADSDPLVGLGPLYNSSNPVRDAGLWDLA